MKTFRGWSISITVPVTVVCWCSQNIRLEPHQHEGLFIHSFVIYLMTLLIQIHNKLDPHTVYVKSAICRIYSHFHQQGFNYLNRSLICYLVSTIAKAIKFSTIKCLLDTHWKQNVFQTNFLKALSHKTLLAFNSLQNKLMPATQQVLDIIDLRSLTKSDVKACCWSYLKLELWVACSKYICKQILPEENCLGKTGQVPQLSIEDETEKECPKEVWLPQHCWSELMNSTPAYLDRLLTSSMHESTVPSTVESTCKVAYPIQETVNNVH